MLTVSLSESIDALRPEWERLERTTSPRLPFAQPMWTALWLRHFAQAGRLIHDELQLLAVRDETGALRGIAPMVLTERPAIGPVRTRMLRMVGADPNITELSGQICAPDDAAAVMEAILGYLEAHRDRWDLVFLNGIREAAVPVLDRRAGLRWGRESPDFLLELPDSWADFQKALGRNVKESLRKCRNSLKRDGHAFSFVVRTRPDEMEEALWHFFRLHSARASQTGTVGHLDVFPLETSRRFLCDFLCEAARVGEARVFQLVIGGEVVATRIGFALGDQLYLYFSGFDPKWGRYSVMTTTVEQILRWAIEAKFRVVNLSPGRDVSKTRWNPIELPFREAYLRSQSLRGGLVYRAYRALREDALGWSHRLGFGRRPR